SVSIVISLFSVDFFRCLSVKSALLIFKLLICKSLNIFSFLSMNSFLEYCSLEEFDKYVYIASKSCSSHKLTNSSAIFSGFYFSYEIQLTNIIKIKIIPLINMCFFMMMTLLDKNKKSNAG